MAARSLRTRTTSAVVSGCLFLTGSLFPFFSFFFLYSCFGRYGLALPCGKISSLSLSLSHRRYLRSSLSLLLSEATSGPLRRRRHRERVASTSTVRINTKPQTAPTNTTNREEDSAELELSEE